jgi:hypothetical protein
MVQIRERKIRVKKKEGSRHELLFLAGLLLKLDARLAQPEKKSAC